ncbi:protein C17H12.11 [Ditylenchus destructor]|uniref:Protein C17H12.11 n=1 Tax=Ditylenchus destructor TaxID=166010 RepID=A0AAD4R5B2_9BILA|nr:protein C17H12.11 [Ditylenchus destructor]
MKLYVRLIGFSIFIILFAFNAFGLKCYTGFKFIRGQGVGEDSKQCESDSDYCYNMTADGGFLISVAKAGCSTYRCLLSRDTCRSTEFQGVPVSFCCCSEDLCNGRD